MNIKHPVFFAKRGYWGEHGYIRIPFHKWIWIRDTFVTKVKWIKCFK